jgi:predicted S18 family serine protease
MKKVFQLLLFFTFTFNLTSCNTVKYAKEQNLVNVVEPIERSDYPDTEEAFYSIQNVIGQDMTINRAEVQMAAKAELALKIQTAVSAIAKQQLSSLSDGANAKQTQNAFDQRVLSTSQLSIAKVMLVDSKLLRDRESQNYDYWVVYKVLLDDVVEVINQSDLGVSVNSLDLFKNQ